MRSRAADILPPLGIAIAVICGVLWFGAAKPPSLSRDALQPIQDDLTLDLGALAHAAPRLYQIQRGDILGRVAQRELGSVRDIARIVALNPGLDPDHLKPGTTLRLPPRREAAGGYAFYLWRLDSAGAQARGESGLLQPLAHEQLVQRLAGPARLLALPLASQAEGEAALRRASAFDSDLPLLPDLKFGPTITPLAMAHAHEETARALHTIRVEAVAGDAIEATVDLTRFDDKGHTLQPLPVTDSLWHRPLLLGLLVLVLILTVLWIARRLERSAQPPLAGEPGA